MFAVTGGLYTVGVKGGYNERTVDVTLGEPLGSELGGLVAAAEKALGAEGLSAPTGAASVRKGGAGAELDWTGANRDISLKPTADPLKAQLTIKDTTPHRRLVQLHKAKGSAVSKAISVVWVFGLLLLFATGMGIAFGAPTYRRTAVIASIVGVVSFVAYVFIG
jgi:hypothetical protein